jgi:hypothetical protein
MWSLYARSRRQAGLVLGRGWWGVSIRELAWMIVLLGGVLLAGFLMR